MSRYTPASRRRFPVSLPKASAMLAPRSKYVDSKIVDPSIDPTMSHTPYTLVVQAVPRCSIHHTPWWSKLSHVVPYTLHPGDPSCPTLFGAPERKTTTVRWFNHSDYYPTVIQLQRAYCPTAIHIQRLLPHGNPYTKSLLPHGNSYRKIIAPRQSRYKEVLPLPAQSLYSLAVDAHAYKPEWGKMRVCHISAASIY